MNVNECGSLPDLFRRLALLAENHLTGPLQLEMSVYEPLSGRMLRSPSSYFRSFPSIHGSVFLRSPNGNGRVSHMQSEPRSPELPYFGPQWLAHVYFSLVAIRP